MSANIFDLFAGCGGASLAALGVMRELGMAPGHHVAVNHWEPALRVHQANHPDAVHYQEDVRRVDPRAVMGAGRVRLGLAGPDCTHHSNARGGKPRDTGQRALAWDVVRWARLVEPESLLIENVPEFASWGPLDENGQRIRERAGEHFTAFLWSLRHLGYTVDWRVLCAAHYGDATTRRRLFVQARRSGAVTWPEPTHFPASEMLPDGARSWRSAAEIIDWSLPGESIWGRKKPLADKTVQRIMEGVKRFAPRSVADPPMTITPARAGNALCFPFLVGIGGPTGRQRPRRIDDPLGTVLGENHQYLVKPFFVRYNDGGRIQPIDAPITTMDGSNRFGLVEPFLISYYGKGGVHDLHAPMPTATGRDRFGLVEPITAHDGSRWIVADIRYRMLQPHELAAAHSFPADFDWAGTNKEERVRLVGNSWPVRLGEALVREVLA